MNITDLLAQAGGLKSIARELGVNEQQVSSGAAALLPALMGGFRKQAQAGGGGDAVAQLLGSLGGSGLLENVLSQHPTDVAQGNALLGTLFGSKEVSRAVAQGAAQQSGVDPALLKKMLPMLAMAVMTMPAMRVIVILRMIVPVRICAGVVQSGLPVLMRCTNAAPQQESSGRSECNGARP